MNFGKLVLITTFLLSAVPALSDQVEKGRLAGVNGKQFPFTFANAEQNGVTVIYVGGLGGRGNEVSKIAKDFTKQGINLLTFDRAEKSCSSTKACRVKVASRVPSHTVMASADGRPSAADDIMKNELSAVFGYLVKSPEYNKKKGIVLIGGSYGSWLSLVATQSKYKSHIKGVVFLSPAIAPFWVTGSKAPPENVKKYKSLAKSFGRRASIAVGGKKDVIVPGASAYDAAVLLSQTLPAKPAVVEAKSKNTHQN